MLEGIGFVRALYGLLGVIACFNAHKLWMIKTLLKQQNRMDDYKIVDKRFKWWMAPLILASVILWLT